MQIDFAFLADSATVRPDGRVDAVAIGAFTVSVEHFPTTVLHFAVVTRVGFAAEDGNAAGNLAVRIIAPDGTPVAEQTARVDAPPIFVTETAGRKRTRVLNFYDVPIPAPGTYRCAVTLNGEAYGDIHFDILVTAPIPA